MIPMSALAGAAGGSMLGQLSDTLGGPRRQVLQLLGQGLAGRGDINSGSALLEAMGASPGGLASGLGGFAVDTAADPLTWLGFAGGPLAESLAGKSLLESIGIGGDAAEGAETMAAAARAAEAANTAEGFDFASEATKKLGRAVTPDDVAAAGPRTGLYAKNMTRSTGMEAGSTVSPNVAMPPGVPLSGPRPAVAAARQGQMGLNAGANDDMMAKAMGAYNDPYQGGQMALPGQMLGPQNPLRSNMLMQMNPQDAQQGINPLIAALRRRQATAGQLGPMDLAALAGTAGGAIGGGVYSGMGGGGR